MLLRTRHRALQSHPSAPIGPRRGHPRFVTRINRGKNLSFRQPLTDCVTIAFPTASSHCRIALRAFRGHRCPRRRFMSSLPRNPAVDFLTRILGQMMEYGSSRLSSDSSGSPARCRSDLDLAWLSRWLRCASAIQRRRPCRRPPPLLSHLILSTPPPLQNRPVLNTSSPQLTIPRY
jgi:hypothetical protein